MSEEKFYDVEAKKIVEFLESRAMDRITIRLAMPKGWVPDPEAKGFTVEVEGLGLVAVHGGSKQYLVVELTTKMLKAAPNVVLSSPDLRVVYRHYNPEPAPKPESPDAA